ncbi:MAG: hypothetical protein IT377_25505 [Polyangiaceae bacterium]|nr:hypothetical protein [Polyangiaceae bacterium]
MSKSRGVWGTAAVAASAVATAACGYVTPPEYSPGAGHKYCAALLESSRSFVNINTPTFLTLAAVTIGFGYLASHFTNDPKAERFIERHVAAFFFVGAMVAGIVATYAHGRADAGSRAASEVQAAMIAKDDRVKFGLCLEAASKWDGSRTDASAAVSAIALDQAKKSSVATIDLAEAVQKTADAREKNAEASETAAVAAGRVLDAVTKAMPADKQTAAKGELESAKEAVQAAKTSAAVAKSSAKDAKAAAVKAQEKAKATEGDPDSLPKPPGPGGSD